MDIKTILSMKKGVKGLEIECGTVKRVMDKQAHKGKEYKGKMLPDWYTQSVLVMDASGETWLQLSKGFLTQEAEGRSLNFKELEINEYTNKKGELVKSLICHEMPLNGATSPQTAQPMAKEGLAQPKPQEAPKTPYTDANQAKKDAFEEKKQLLIVRQNCLGHAVELIRLTAIEGEDIRNNINNTMAIASTLVNYVYTGVNEYEERKTDAGVNTDNLSLKEKGAE